MLAYYFHVKFYSKSRLCRGYYISFFPLYGFLEYLSEEAVQFSYTLCNQEIGTANIKMYVGHKRYRAGIMMRSYLSIIGFCHAGDQPALKDPARMAEVRLQDAGRAGAQNRGELGLCRQPLAGGDRNAHRCRHADAHRAYLASPRARASRSR